MTDMAHHSRSESEQKNLMKRLKIIEGQIRGLEKMVENDVYCPDILIQVSAVNSALNSFSKALLSKHINGCVREDLANGKDESLDELIKVLHKMMK
ncbi:MAG: metal-sensing transcriptional repressor [Erysipelotrichaceae bacterium]|nr:metal-sensing transcriptional repressor [Erysipelotrichaceae bacterium]